MGNTWTSIVQWLSSLSIDWSAWSAVGTIAATLVALFLPFRMAKREWARQDKIRQADAEINQQRRADLQHEVCSAVDRVLAYRDVAIALFKSKPVYWVGIQAIKRVNLNAAILVDVLGLFETRSDLSDGAVYSAVAAKKIAEATVTETTKVLNCFGISDPGWSERVASLANLDELSAMVKSRADGIRSHYGLGESTGAKLIRSKYIPLAEAITASMTADSGAPPYDLTGNYL
jgi:hypothetical protein